MKELDPSNYTIAWIAPLAIEARAALLMLDDRHHGFFPLARGDDYVFRAGAMCGHNVVIAQLPREYGNGAAAALASQLPARDIRLGDVLVAAPEGETAALVAYDLGKETAAGFRLLKGGHAMAPTEAVVQSAMDVIGGEYPDEAKLFLPHYNKIKDNVHRTGTFADPGQAQDTLHITAADGKEVLVERPLRSDDQRTAVWYGPIGSGDRLVKNAKVRDALQETHGLIGLEMEAAGTMSRIAAGVIRGVCDYGDENKNKQWQPYAASMAAAYAKAVLERIPPVQKAAAAEGRTDDRVESTAKAKSTADVRKTTEGEKTESGEVKSASQKRKRDGGNEDDSRPDKGKVVMSVHDIHAEKGIFGQNVSGTQHVQF
ncbi:hypothetical protein LLEC1_00739 [Akanthomyces lecanii]|uniref:Nucleoside phosphorylase domain-containing protein n=1 Tax=Cordyceps confragosa TaxID=2714763 RepID=A0A179I4E8_CORDF|nr:hypothetical protein LLEC1_00739 [Akanthomyces lecanii]